jgi:microcystin-dependent protein
MDPFLGDIRLFAFSGNPRFWVPCAGQVMPIHGNEALFSLLGTNFGGDGTKTFCLPTLAGPNGNSPPFYRIALQGVYPSSTTVSEAGVSGDAGVALA